MIFLNLCVQQKSVMYMCYFVSYSCCTLKHVCSTSVFLGCLPKTDRAFCTPLIFQPDLHYYQLQRMFPFMLLSPPLSISVPLITFVNCVNYSTSVSFSFNADLICIPLYLFLTMYQSSIEYKLALNSKTHYNIHYHVLDLIWKNYTSVQNTYISY